ncbi:hypothetical protein PIB30_023810 [Stylosanthes scabra]|uniref:Rubredoxin-like domain-containing protein n=1 Tax=Stylosanthes scabra TaxID=79078 RepID=A0ABU6Z6A0_9FABA|nr:hypothetical protein [Stylosanthes scabra]
MSATGVVAAGSATTFTATSSIKNSKSKTLLTPTSLQGLSLHEAKRSLSHSFFLDTKTPSSSSISTRRRLDITARTAGASKQIEGIEGGGNAARAGLKVGDQVLYTSSFFGDELWPADKLGFTKTAIQAKPDSVYFVVSRGAEVDVKRLPKRPAPPAFGRKLTDAQKARATHICLDCGYIYTLQKPFEDQPDTYGCPQCQAPKKRFAKYDVNTGRAIGGNLPPIGVIIGLLAGVGAVGALLLYGLQ